MEILNFTIHHGAGIFVYPAAIAATVLAFRVRVRTVKRDMQPGWSRKFR